MKDIWTVGVAQYWDTIFENRRDCHLATLSHYNLRISNSFIQTPFVSLLSVHFARLNEST